MYRIDGSKAAGSPVAAVEGCSPAAEDADALAADAVGEADVLAAVEEVLSTAAEPEVEEGFDEPTDAELVPCEHATSIKAIVIVTTAIKTLFVILMGAPIA